MGYNSVADNTGLSSFVWLLLHPKHEKCIEIPTEYKENLTLQQFKVIQGHRSTCQWNAHMWLPISHLLPFSRYSGLKIENCRFYPPLPCLTPPSGGTPWDIDVFYISLKSAFNGLQFRRWHYRSIFIRLAVVASQSRNHAKFRQNLTLQQFKVIQGHRSWCQSKAHIRLSISH